MWETVLSVIVKYWVEVILGLIVTGGTFFIKRYRKLDLQDRKAAQEAYYAKLTEDVKKNNEALIAHFSEKYQYGMGIIDERYEEITSKVKDAMIEGRAESKADDEKLEKRIDSMDTNFTVLKNGILSLQGKMFKDACRELLKEDHEITLEEWEEIDAAHDTYNSLGGNHNGDYLYSLVSKKAEHTLTD